MGILEILSGLSGNNQQPYGGMLYPSPIKSEAEQAQEAREAAAARLAGRALPPSPGGPGSPFGPVPVAPEAPTAPPAFMPGASPIPFAPAGASPFSLAGPGANNAGPPAAPAAPAAAAPSMPIAPPAAPLASAAPAAAPLPAPRPVAANAGSSTDLSSVNRGAAAASAGVDGPSPAANPAAAKPAPFSLAGSGSPGMLDRVSAALESVQGSRGLIPSIFNGARGAMTGERADPASRATNATAQALIGKGASPADVQAAQNNPALMQQLIAQHYGPKQVQALGEGYVWNTRTGKAEKVYDPAGKSSTIVQDAASREAIALKLGLKPGDPAYQGFVAAGKWPKENEQPLSAGDKKAIGEADDKIVSIRQAIDNLNQAKTMSKRAYDGPLASQRAAVSSVFGSESGTNTADLENLVTTNSLGQLKAIFGGNPTEGERKILLEVQGSVNQPDAVRQRIWDRAIQIAQAKLTAAEQRSNEMRGGNFYKPGGGMTSPAAPAASGKTSSGITWSVQ